MKRLVGLVAPLTVLWIMSAPASGNTYETDLDFCVVPVPVGDTGGSRLFRHPHITAQFIPGHPTPVIRQSFFHCRSAYFGMDGVLHHHPEPHVACNYSRYFFGASGYVYKSGNVFDPELGYFRPIQTDEEDLRNEYNELYAAYVADIDGFGPSSPGYIGRGHPPSYSYVSDLPDNGSGGSILPIELISLSTAAPLGDEEAARQQITDLSLDISNTDTGIRLTTGEREVVLASGRFSAGVWWIQPLTKSDRFLVTDGHQYAAELLVVDANLNVTVPSGAWRVGSVESIVAMPDRGEALVSGTAGIAWVRDRRISGDDACENQEPPPPAHLAPVLSVSSPVPEELRGPELTTIPGTDVEFQINEQGEFSWYRDGQMIGQGTCRIEGDDSPSCDEPLALNPHTGAIWLNDGRWILRTGILVEGHEFEEPAAHPEWLDLPLLGGFLWGENNELIPIDPGFERYLEDWLAHRRRPWGYEWVELPRFRLLVTVQNGHWRYLGTDLDLRSVNGQPAGDDYLHVFDLQGSLFDPGYGAYLLGTRRGVWEITDTPAMRQVSCGPDCEIGAVTSFAYHPTSDRNILVGAHGGLYVYRPNENPELERLIPAIETGSVKDLFLHRESGTIIIESDFGYFTWLPNEGLRRIQGFGEWDPWARPEVVVDDMTGRVAIGEYTLVDTRDN